MKYLVVLVVLCVTVASIGSGEAVAGTIGGGGDGPSGCLGLGYLGPFVSASGECSGGRPVPPKPAQARRRPSSHVESSSGGDYWKAVRGPGYGACAGGTAGQYVQEYDPQGNPIGSVQLICANPSSSTRLAPPPPPPPPPPTAAEVEAEVPLPSATIAFNPKAVGLTQLPTLFWARGVAQPVEVGIDVGGYTITTDAFPISYEWNFGDGASAVSKTAGSASAPAVTHTYSNAGTYKVSVLVEYTGTFNYAGPGGSGTQSLGDYESGPFSFSYTVQQVRSVLVPVPAG
jgi:hypothetical protein